MNRLLSRAGIISSVAAALGALSALVLLAWPPQVAGGVLSYPFTTAGHSIAQTWFFVQHLALALALVALATTGVVGTGRLPRAAAWVAVAGMVGLALTELLAIGYAEWDEEAANAGPMGAAYGICVTVIGLAMLVVGIVVLRARRWTGWRRWTPLVIGIATFTVLTPGMFGGFVIARLAIGFWMLLFAALGWSLHAERRPTATSGTDAGLLAARATR